MLNDVVETCNFKFVLSSCWRYGEYLSYTNYAILDDECDYMLLIQEPNVYKCDFDTGLTSNICYRMKLKYNKLLDNL